MVFVEHTRFVRFREQHWTNEGLRGLRRFLLVTPAAGGVIRGTGGLRTLCWAASGRGKRGGARKTYYLQTTLDRIDLAYGYVKASQEDATRQQPKVPAALTKEVDDG